MADQHPGCGGALRPTGTSGRYKCERCGQVVVKNLAWPLNTTNKK